MSNLFQNVTENLLYVLSFLVIIILLFAAAVLLEKAAQKKTGKKEPLFQVRKGGAEKERRG